MTTEAQTRPPPARWWSRTSWTVYHQALSTGHCPFCGAPLPEVAFPLSYSAGYVWTYAGSCPECGQRNYPFSLRQLLVLGVGGPIALLIVSLVLLFAVGTRAFAACLLVMLVGVLTPCCVVLLRRGRPYDYFNAACLVIAMAVAGHTLVPVIIAHVSTVDAAAAMPSHEETGKQITAVISIYNTTASTLYPVMDWPDHDMASALDAHISTADWQLQQISADGEAMQLDPRDRYDLPSLDSGEGTTVKLILRPLHPGRHRFRVEIYDDATNSAPKPAVLSLAAIVRGKRIPPPPPPLYAVTMRATMTSRQVKGQAVPLQLVIHNTGTSITNVHLNLADAISLNSQWLQYFSDEDWGVKSVTVNGQAIDVPDDSNVGEYDLGPLAAHHDMHVTVSVVPRIAGTHTLQVKVYYPAVSSKPLRTTDLRATIAS